MTSNLMNPKSAFTKRRLIVMFILCTILGVMVMTGFSSGLNSDPTHNSAEGKRIVMYADVPETGTPEEHDLISNVKYAAQRLYTSPYFRGETTGKVVAELGLGIKYTQNVHNVRVVKNGKIFSESISSSTMKSVAEQKYFSSGTILKRNATSVNGASATFANSVSNITKTYYDNYGLLPNELTKQCISDVVTEDFGITILSVSDNNAKTKSAANNNGEQSAETAAPTLDIDVPQSLVRADDGHYSVTLVLDPAESTKFSRSEVRTLAGADPDKNPVYQSVRVTITIDDNWYPVSITAVERYDIEIPGIGAMTCTSTLTEKFSDIGNTDGVLPEEEFFESHIKDAGVGEEPVAPTAVDYLTAAFGKYISGADSLDLRANLSVGGVKINNLDLSVNIATMNIRAKYNKLFVEYIKAAKESEKDKVYITLNNIKGYLPIDKVMGLVEDESVKKLMSSIKLPDLGGISADGIISGMKLETSEGVAKIHIPLNLGEGISGDAYMTLDDKDKSLKSITASLKAFGIEVALDAAPRDNLSFAKVDETYADLSPVIDFIPAALDFISNETYGISGTVDLGGTTIGTDLHIALDAYVDRVKGVADGTATVLNNDIAFKYIDGEILLSSGKLGVKAKADELPELITAVTDALGVDLTSMFAVKDMLPESIGGWIAILQDLTVDNSSLKIGARLIGVPINIVLTRDGNSLTGLALDVSVDLLGINVNAAIDLDLSSPERHEVTRGDVSYADAKEIVELIPTVLDYAEAESLTVSLGGNVNIGGTAISIADAKAAICLADPKNVSANATVSALGESANITYIGGVAYIQIGNISIKLDTADIDYYKTEITALLDRFGVALPDVSGALGDNPVSSVLDGIKLFDVKDGVITISLELLGANVDLTVNVNSGAVTIDGTYDTVSFDLDATVSEQATQITAPVNPEAFTDAKEIVELIPTVLDYAEAEALTVSVGGNVNIGGTAISLSNTTAAICLAYPKNVSANATVSAFGESANITYIGGVAYVQIGNISIKLDTADIDYYKNEITALLDRFGVALPDMSGALGDNPVSSVLDGIKHFDVKDGVITLSIELLGATVDLTINVNSGAVTVDGTYDTVSFDLDATVSAESTSIAAPVNPDAFTDAKEIVELIPTVLDYAEAESLTVSLGGNVNIGGTAISLTNTTAAICLADPKNVSANATVSAFGESANITYIGGVAYISLGNIAVKLDTADIGYYKDEITALLNRFGVALPDVSGALGDNPVSSVLDGITNFDVKDGVITISLELLGANVDLTVNVNSGAVTIDGTYNTVSFDLDATVSEQATQITAPVNPEAFTDAKELLNLVENALPFVDAKGATFGFAASYGEYDIGGTAALDLSDLANGVRIALGITNIDITNVPNVSLDITVVGDTVYINTTGGNFDFAISASTNDITAVIDALGDKVPVNVRDMIVKIVGVVNDVNGTLNSMLGGMTPDNALSAALDAIRLLTVKDGKFDAQVSLAALTGTDADVSLSASSDLTALNANATISGKTVTAGLTDIKSGAAIAVPVCDYITASELMPIVNSVLPLLDAQGFELPLSAEIFGLKISGTAYIALPSTEAPFGVKASVLVGDIPVIIAFTNNTVFVDIDNGRVAVSCGTSKEELTALVDELSNAIPKLARLIEKIKQSALYAVIGNPLLLTDAEIALAHTETGLKLTVDLLPLGFTQTIELGLNYTDEAFTGIAICATGDLAMSVSADIGHDATGNLALSVSAEISLDTTDGIDSESTDSIKFTASVGITSLKAQQVEVTGEFLPVSALLKYIAPVAEIVKSAKTASSLTLALDTKIVTSDSRYLPLNGKISIEFAQLAVYADLLILGEHLYVTYIDNTLYIKLGKIELKFDTTTGNVKTDVPTADGNTNTATGDGNTDVPATDKQSDITRIYNVLKGYLPKYLSDELAIIFKLEEGTSRLDKIGALIDSFKALIAAKTPEQIVSALFDGLSAGTTSFIKGLVDKLDVHMGTTAPVISIELGKRDDVATPTENTTIDVTPLLTEKNALGVEVSTKISSLSVKLDVTELMFSTDLAGITAPVSTAGYMSVVDYVELINNLINTFTTENTNGDVTFRIDTLNFTYQGKDKKVTDKDDNVTTESGKTITVANDGNQPVLKGIFPADGGIQLEAHVLVSGASKHAGDISLALYVLSDYTVDDVSYGDIAYLCYKESGMEGYGENLSIDYGSVMQILASVLKILGVKDTTLQKIIPNPAYRVSIDTTVFESMDIMGLDKVRDMLDSLIDLLIKAEGAVSDVKDAWKLVKAPDSAVDTDRNGKIDMLLDSLDKIFGYIKSAVNRFASAPETTDPTVELTEITVPGFSDIVNGITLNNKDGNLGANVKNKLTTKGEGEATIFVAQSDSKVNGVIIDNLDVNSAVIACDVKFTSGCQDITIAPDIAAITSVTDKKNKITYSNLANLKYLLFDVMNTANLMEFEMGNQEGESITLKLIKIVDLTINYNIKVKIVDCGKDAVPRYKTAAFVELRFEKTLGAVASGSTHLTFFDNKFYIEGFEWKYREWTTTFIGKIKHHETWTEPVKVSYTLDEFTAMTSDMEKLCKQFLFYLVPLHIDYLGTELTYGTNLQQTIIDAINSPDSSGASAKPTIATVFKGYTYGKTKETETTDKHTLKIGLKELTGNGSLSDVTVSIAGANDDVANLYDNYISELYVSTTLASVVDLSLGAKLDNVYIADDENGTARTYSTGLTDATIGDKTYTFDKLLTEYIPSFAA